MAKTKPNSGSLAENEGLRLRIEQLEKALKEAQAGTRVDAPEASRLSEERLRLALEGAQQGLWDWDIATGAMVCDERGRALFDLSAGGNPSFLSVLGAVHPGDRQRLADATGASLQSGAPLRIEFRIVRQDGTVRWLQSRSQAFLDQEHGATGRMSGIVYDITDRKLAQQALEEALAEAEEGRRTLEVLMESVPEGITIADVEGERLTVRMVSRHGQEMLGGPQSQLTLEQVSERWKVFRPDGRTPLPPEELPLRRAIQRGEPVRDAEVVQLDARGEALHLLCNAAPIRDGRDEVIGGVVAWSDIGERKRMEDELRTANLKLAEADRRKNEFLAQLSHELRNPLAPIRSSLHVLHRAAPDGDQARRAKEIIDRQVGQLVRLVDDLLDVTRITRNKIQLQRQPLELNELVRRSLEDYRAEFDKGEVALELAAAPGPVLVDADGNRLAQVVGNLLQNAAKFTGPGGKTFVRVVTEPARQQAVVEVADTGIGMDERMLARVFQPFAQADSSLDRGKGGLGLGLALVRGLVELHGGEVSAHSDGLGKGSRVVVRLPLQASARAEPAAAHRADPPGRRRILIIEDNVDAADSLGEVLQMDRHQVAIAHDGHDGLAKVKAFRPDVVLCDIGLPGMDGYAVARAIRADEALKDVFLVALSGYAMPEDLQRAAEAGFERHLAKPPSLEKLAELLSTVPRS
ncbi:MAG TPA: ATP-binding protein [Myxococcales bacterium]|jgi:PAS domain S-box-containing protein